MAEEQEPKKTPHDVLIEALEKVEQMNNVLVIWDTPEGKTMGSLDSDMTIAEVLYATEMFRHWLLRHALGDS